jgi:hypothetical protein
MEAVSWVCDIWRLDWRNVLDFVSVVREPSDISALRNCFLSLSLDIILYLLFFLDGVEPLIESAGLAEEPNSCLEIDVSEFRTGHGHIISISKSPSCLSWVGTG